MPDARREDFCTKKSNEDLEIANVCLKFDVDCSGSTDCQNKRKDEAVWEIAEDGEVRERTPSCLVLCCELKQNIISLMKIAE